MTAPEQQREPSGDDAPVLKDAAYYAEVRRAVGRGAPTLLLGTSTRSLERSLERLEAAQRRSVTPQHESDDEALPDDSSHGKSATSSSSQIEGAGGAYIASPDLEDAESEAAEQARLVRLVFYWLPDDEAAGRASHGLDLRPDAGRLLVRREVVRPDSQADIDSIESLRIQYDRTDINEGRREEIRAAAADFATSSTQGPVASTLWETSQSFPLSDAADLLYHSADLLRGLFDIEPMAYTGSPEVSIAPGISANLVMSRSAAPPEGIARVYEVAGIVIGSAAGARPLVLFSAKRFGHDEVGALLARAFEHALRTDRTLDTRLRSARSDPPQISKPDLVRERDRRPERRSPDEPGRTIGPKPPRARDRLLERLGKLDEALLDGRISFEQYEEMRARAEQERDWSEK